MRQARALGSGQRWPRAAAGRCIDVRLPSMRSVHVYPGNDGWFYELRIAQRVVVFGWTRTREGALKAAETA